MLSQLEGIRYLMPLVRYLIPQVSQNIFNPTSSHDTFAVGKYQIPHATGEASDASGFSKHLQPNQQPRYFRNLAVVCKSHI